MKSEALLAGRIFDDRGNRMTPEPCPQAGHQVPVLSVVRPAAGPSRNAPDRYAGSRQPRSRRWSQDRFGSISSYRSRLTTGASSPTHVARVEVQPDQLVIELAQVEKTTRRRAQGASTLRVPWHKTPSTRRREILLPDSVPPQHARPIRSETRATLVASIARGRRWLNELIDDAKANVESIAKRERCSVRQVNMTISLAFLAPDLVKAAIEGRLPRGIGVTRLRDAPIEWSRQQAMLGLTN